MRTVDPAIWSKRHQKPPINVTRPFRFGQKVDNSVEKRVRVSFCDAMKEFIQHCSAEGTTSVTDVNLSKGARICWSIYLILIFIVGIWMISDELVSFSDRPPLFVSQKSNHHKIEDIDFPAVAVCSPNIISKRKLKEMAKLINMSDRNYTYTLQQIEYNLRYFGALVSGTAPALDLQFMTFLRQIYPGLNITRLMYQLSPPCTTMLVRCSWHGKIKPCESIFVSRAMQFGFCCVFNSLFHPGDNRMKSKRLNAVGQDEGLSIMLYENPDDFAYIRRPVNGFEIFIFSATEFPMLESGVLRSYPVGINASVFMTLRTSVQLEAKSVLEYSEQWRGCRAQTLYTPGSSKSYAWCLADCRRTSVQDLCGCVPFYLLPEADEETCSLRHLNCLNKHREKFLYLYPYPGGVGLHALREETMNSMDCECIPDCSRKRYSAVVTHARHYFREKLFKNYFINNISLTNVTILRVFFTHDHQHVYVIEGNLRLFEAIATVASQWVFLLGVTFVTGLELIFHLTFRWTYHYRRRSRLVGHRLPPLKNLSDTSYVQIH